MYLWDVWAYTAGFKEVNTAQKKHYPPGNHHASHFLKCRIYRFITTMLTTSTDDLTL